MQTRSQSAKKGISCKSFSASAVSNKNSAITGKAKGKKNKDMKMPQAEAYLETFSPKVTRSLADDDKLIGIPSDCGEIVPYFVPNWLTTFKENLNLESSSEFPTLDGNSVTDNLPKKYPSSKSKIHKNSLGDPSSSASFQISPQIPTKLHSESKDWANIAGTSSKSSDMKIHHIPLENRSDLSCIIPKEVGKMGEQQWETSMLGHFFDKKLPYSVVKTQAFKLWAKFGLDEVISCCNGFFLFKFSTSVGRDKVLELGPWNMINRQIFIKRWDNNQSFSREEISKVPIWVKFH